MRRFLAFVLLAVMLMTALSACRPEHSAAEDATAPEAFSSTGEDRTEAAAPKPLEDPYAIFEQRYLTLFAGDSFDLDYGIVGEGDVRWTSSDACVSVVDGEISALGEGSAVICGGGADVCYVRVLPEEPSRLYVDAGGVAITSKEEYVTCRISVDSDNDAHDLSSLSAGIRVRGNSTSRRPKKPYRIKFESKQNLLGMNGGAKCKSWVLLAEYQDDSMIRTSSCLSAAEMILDEYASDWRYVSLYINGEYVGVYSLCEQSQINGYRIDIEEAGEDSPNVRSGYLFELDASPPHDGKILVSYSDFQVTDLLGKTYTHSTNDDKIYGLMRYSLKNDGCSDAQRAFAERYIQNVLRILYAATYQGVYYGLDSDAGLILSSYTTAEETISAVIDVESLVRMYLFSELICNGDEYKKSFYMYVDFSEDGTGLLTFACPWDFDGAIVKWNTYDYQSPNSYFAACRNLWYVMAMKNEWFFERVCKTWQELYNAHQGFWSLAYGIRRISSAYAQDFTMDAKLWARQYDQAAEAEKTAKWFVARIAWMNRQFGTDLPQ